jgi:hypothetical protein
LATISDVFVFIKIFVQTSQEAIKSGGNAKEKKNNQQPGMSSEVLIQEITHEKPDSDGRREDQTKRAYLGHFLEVEIEKPLSSHCSNLMRGIIIAKLQTVKAFCPAGESLSVFVEDPATRTYAPHTDNDSPSSGL